MADDTDSDSGIGVIRRIAEQKDLVPQIQQEPSTYLSMPKQDSGESSDTVLIPNDEQESVDFSLKKKVKCSFHESQPDIRDNQQLGVDHDVGSLSAVEHNLEMADSLSLKQTVSGAGWGICEMKIGNGGQEVQDGWDIDTGFIAGASNVEQEGDFSGSVDGKAGEFGKGQMGFSEVQESNKLKGEFSGKRVASKEEKSVSEAEIGSGFSQKLGFYENEKIVTGPKMESESILEAEKKRLLAELEVGSFFEGKTRVEKVTSFRSFSLIDEKENDGQKLQKMAQNDGEETDPFKGTDGLVRRSLTIEVIDETALIETVLPVPTDRIGSTKEAETMGSGKNGQKEVVGKNGGKEIVEKKAKQSRRKGKGKGKDGKLVLGTFEKYKNFTHFLELHNGGKENGDHSKRMYSRKELEDLRFAKIVEQRKLWKDICTALGTKIMREYNDLASNKHQKCIQSNFARKEDTSAIPSMVAALGRGNRLNIFVH